MKSLFFALFLFGLCNFSQAQTIVRKNSTGSQMQIGQKATAADIYAAFGKPDKEYSHYDDAAGGNKTTCKYKNLIISIVDNIVYDFGVYADDFSVCIHDKYIAKVGMPLQTFRDSIPATEVQIEVRGKFVLCWFKIPNSAIFSDESLLIIPDAQGIIRDISWSVPD